LVADLVETLSLGGVQDRQGGGVELFIDVKDGGICRSSLDVGGWLTGGDEADLGLVLRPNFIQTGALGFGNTGLPTFSCLHQWRLLGNL
jgi:hypothetical protein